MHCFIAKIMPVFRFELSRNSAKLHLFGMGAGFVLFSFIYVLNCQ